jgi:hypothetical protein
MKKIKFKSYSIRKDNLTLTVQSNSATAIYLASGLTTTTRTSSFIFIALAFDKTRFFESCKLNRNNLASITH